MYDAQITIEQSNVLGSVTYIIYITYRYMAIGNYMIIIILSGVNIDEKI